MTSFKQLSREEGLQQGEHEMTKKPLLMQIFEKNKDFKGLLLRHIFYYKTLVRMAEQVLQHYVKTKEIMVSMSYSLINYAEILEKFI